jgi:hypothetical protein
MGYDVFGENTPIDNLFYGANDATLKYKGCNK